LDPTADVNPEQLRAITYGGGPLLVVAGAGSGKTRVITRRIAQLVQDGVPPWTVTALTFTNKAAREMRERVEQIVTAPDLWVCTFHGFAARVLRRYGHLLGYTREFSIYDTEDKNQLIKALLKEQGFDELRPAEVSHALTRVKNGMERPELPGHRAEQVSRVMRLYGERMREANAMDFDDLLVNLHRLLRDDVDVRAKMQIRAQWLLVDEYQDTNGVQYRILGLLAGSQRNVCATGDPDQSIYRWRGATVENILKFSQDFPGAETITLDRNYRSTKPILDVANAVIRHNTGRFEKDLRTDKTGGVAVREVRCRDDIDEARMVAREIQTWTGGGRSAKEIAVFYRVNAQSRVLERAFHELGIPYRIVGAVEFYKRKEVKDLLAYVRVARNPSDITALRRIFNVPARKLGKTTADRFFASGTPRETLRDRDALVRFGRARKALAGFADLLDAIEEMTPSDPAAYIRKVIELTAYRDHLGEGTAMAERDRLENVDELVNAAADYSLRDPEGGIDGFVEENALVADQDTYDETAEAATMMTVHAAKGLEFECVCVAGLEEELFPHGLSMDEPEEVEEERRLFYVAATRAREELVLLHGQRRLRQGMPMPALPSRFLDEIPDELLEVEDRTGRFGGGGGTFGDVSEDEPVYYVNETPGASSSGYRTGDRVRHHHFGKGKVLAVRKSGGATRITVDFDDSGRRELSMEYARLERL
jgi:DNA helicase-2/ATP-dependent DNA helicase PcrA